MNQKIDTLGSKYLLQGKIVSGKTIITNGVIAVSGEHIVYSGSSENFDFTNWPKPNILKENFTLLPGLVDLHCHGANGGDFSAGNINKNLAAIDYLHKSGTTTLVASLLTSPTKQLIEAIKTLKNLVHKNLLAGIHCEGPFLSSKNCGAQNPKWLQNPNLETAKLLIEAAEDTLVTMTYAPELPKSSELVNYLVSSKVIPSIGHTNANQQITKSALEQSCALLLANNNFKTIPTVTHMFNGMTPFHHRNNGPVTTLLNFASNKKIILEIIADGIHVNSETIALVFKLVGCENIALITDSIAASGLPDGNYTLGERNIVVKAGSAHLEGSNQLAGSVTSLLNCVKFAVSSGVDLVDALISATATPAKVLRQENNIGSLQKNSYADIIAVNDELELMLTIRRGEKIFDKIFCKNYAKNPVV